MPAPRSLLIAAVVLLSIAAPSCAPAAARPCRNDAQCEAGQVCLLDGDDVGVCGNEASEGEGEVGEGEGEAGEGEGEAGEGEGEGAPASPWDAVAVDVGSGFACAVDGAQRVQCWGTNFRGQLGRSVDGNRDDTPVPVRGLSQVSLLAVGDAHACAFGLRAGDAARALVCWGDATDGNLGVTGSVPAGTLARAALGLRGDVVALDADGDNNGGLTCASDGATTECFGAGLAVTPVAALRDVSRLAVSLTAVCGTKTEDGAVVCVDVRANRATLGPLDCPPQTSCDALTGVRDFSVDVDAFCVVDDAGAVVCAGDNEFGVVVPDAPSAGARDAAVVIAAGATDVAVGTQHACAVVAGAVSCWGRPIFGATGVLEQDVSSTCATPDARCQPVTAVRLPFGNVVDIATHRTNSCVRSSSGRVACFGSFVDDAQPAAREFALAE